MDSKSNVERVRTVSNYYVLHVMVGDGDYFAEKADVSEENLYKLSVAGESLRDRALKIVLKKNKGLVRDVIENVQGIPVFSERVVRVIHERAHGEVELFEVKVNMGPGLRYFFLNILGNVDAIDYERSEVVEVMPGTGVLSEIKKLVLDDSAIGSRQIFRLKYFRFLIVVSKALKNALQALNLPEMKFVPVDEVVWKAGSINRY